MSLEHCEQMEKLFGSLPAPALGQQSYLFGSQVFLSDSRLVFVDDLFVSCIISDERIGVDVHGMPRPLNVFLNGFKIIPFCPDKTNT